MEIGIGARISFLNMKYIAVAAERNRKKMSENSRKSITWSAVPSASVISVKLNYD